MNTPVLFFKALGAQKFKNQPGYYLHEGHWHAVGADGHVPKGAPQAHHPEAAGYHAPAAHFSPDEWASLKLPDTNVNAPAYNKGLEKLKEWSDAGNVTAIVGAGFGTNTYGKKLVIIANKLLAMHGSEHKVVAGQKAGEHAVAAGPAQSAAPAPAPAPTPIEPAAAALPDLDTPEDMAANHTHGTIPMPEFQEGKNIAGVKEYYEGVAQKIIDQAHASNVANLEAMKESGLKPNSKGKVSNTWAGKTPNSKILLALHAQALEHAKGAPAPAPVEAANPPAAVPAGWEGSAKGVITKPGDSGGMVDENAAGKGWFVIANNDAANEAMSGKFFPTQADAVAALDAALAPAPAAAHKPHTQHALPDLDGVLSKKPQGLGAMNGGAVADTIASHYKAGDLKALQSIKENLFTPTAVGPALYDGKAKKAMGEFLDAAIAKLSPVAESVALADFKTDAMAPTLSKKAFTGSNQVWHSQQKLGDVVFAAGSTMMGQGANDHTKKMAAQIKAAQAAGYKVGYYKTAGLQAVYVFQKDGQLLTQHGAAKLAEGTQTTSSLPPHLSKLAEKLDGKPVPGATVTDVTPAGYGPEPESGPKEGDTKPGANGTTLVLKDGHWVTQGGDVPAHAKKVIDDLIANGDAKHAMELYGPGSDAKKVVQDYVASKALALSDAEMPDYPENLPALQMVYCSKAGKAADAGDLQGVKDALSSLGHTEGKAFNYITSLITKMEAKAAGAPATAATPTEAVAKGDDLTPPKITTGSGHTSAWSETVESAYVAYSNGDWSALAEFAQEAAGALTEPGKIAQAYIAKLQAKAPKPAPGAVTSEDEKYLAEMFPGGQPNSTQPIVPPAPSAESLAGALSAAKAAAKAELVKWTTKQYKPNSTSIELAGDGPKAGDSISIGAINEGKKSNAIAAASHEIGVVESLETTISTKNGANGFAALLHKTMIEAQSSAAMDGKKAEDVFEYLILQKLGIQPPTGAYLSNGLSKALRALCYGEKAPAPAPTTTPGALTPTQLGNLQSIPWFKQKLPDTNTNAKSHNAAVAKIEAMAFAGDAAGLSAFASSKENAKQTYAKKQYLLAVTAMAALQEGGAAAPAAPAAPAKPTTADTPLTAEQLGALGKLSDAELAAIDGAPGLDANVVAWIKNKLASTSAKKAQAPVGTKVKTIGGVTAFKTEGGSWQLQDSDTKAAIANTNSSASKELTAGYAPHADWFAGKGATDGNKEVVAEIALQAGADPQHVLGTLYPGAPVGTVKEDLDFGNSYELTNSGWKKVVAAGDNGPKEGDTKMGADGMLVLKNGHWVKMEPDAPAAPKAKKLPPGQAIQVMKTVPGTASGMKAKLKALAVAGDVPGLEKFIADHPSLGQSKKAAKKLIEAMTDGTPETPQSPKKKSAPQAPKVAVPTSFVPTTPGAPASMDHWQQVGPQGGSNPGGKFRDHLGQDWYCKFPADEDIAKSEVLAAKLYELSGITGQDAKLITKNGKVGIASKWTTVSKADSPTALSAVEGVHQGFMVDAWLGNWDVVGLGYDNLQIGADGKAVRVDAGGSLEYRAQGAKKPFGSKVDEIDTLRNAAINPQSAAVFGSMTDADIAASAAKVAAVDDEHIRVLVGLYGPGTDAEKKALADTLIARKADIIARYPNAAPKKKPPAAPVYRIPEAPDFENWNGAGKGLSSKPAFNKQNQELAQKINELGNAGDVDAVKNMTYQPINEAGAPVGDEKLVLNHSSTHIPNYLKDVIFAMTTPYVSPKLMFRDAIKNMSGAFKAMSLMFPGFSALKEAAQSVGRYAVLGVAKAGNPIQGWKPKLTSKKQGTIDVQTLYNQSVANFKNLSATERQSIKDYTGHHYGNMNSALLLGTNHDMAYTAITAMKKASVPLPPGAILGRRFQFNKALDGTDNNENHEKAMAELLAHGEGAVLQEFGLISTSTNSMFWSGKVHLKITVGEGVKGLYVDHNPATHSGAISSSPNENEIMLPYGTRFLVTKIHPKGHKFSDETGEWGMKYGDEQVIEVTVLPNL